MIVSGSGLSVRSAKLEGAVVQCIRDWATAFPDELIVFDQQMKAARAQGLYRANSSDNAGAHFGDVPKKLYGMMCRRIHRNWFNDERLCNLFFENFTVGKIRRNDRIPEANLKESA